MGKRPESGLSTPYDNSVWPFLAQAKGSIFSLKHLSWDGWTGDSLKLGRFSPYKRGMRVKEKRILTNITLHCLTYFKCSQDGFKIKVSLTMIKQINGKNKLLLTHWVTYSRFFGFSKYLSATKRMLKTLQDGKLQLLVTEFVSEQCSYF